MANNKIELFKLGPMTERKRNIIQELLQEYYIHSAADIQKALKDLLGGTIKAMMESELDEHLGYEKSGARTAMITGTTTRRNRS
jgi:transposase-like protein